jgi:phosphoribosyl 1,2-cyclic phosphodiesterase
VRLRFSSLGSGSAGNSTLIEAQAADGRVRRVLVDCGFSLRELTRRLALRGCAPFELDAAFITHEHSDHVGSVMTLLRKHRVPVWMSEGTWRAIGREHAPPPGLQFARDGQAIDLGVLQLQPFAVPHDAREPLQLTLTDGQRRLGILTDLGSVTDGVVQALQRCDALLLECNHDLQMLHEGPYPAFLKRRIAGARGHLANLTAASLLQRCRHGALKHVVAAHLSEQNNRPPLAAAALAGALGARAEDVVVATASDGSAWLDLH